MFKHLPSPAIGGNPETTSAAPAPSSKPVSLSPQAKMAASAVDRLFDLLPPQDVGNPEAFLAATIALFSSYAPEVMNAGAFEIAKRSDRPTLRLMTEVLDDLDSRARERESVAKRLPPPKDPKRTPEEQARAQQLAASVRRSFGIPPEGLQRR